MQPFKLRPTDGADWFRANIKCQAACPVHTEAFAYVSALAEEDHEAAYAIARRPNPWTKARRRRKARSSARIFTNRGEWQIPNKSG